MPQIVSCPECDKKLRVPDDLVGQKVRCPGCNGMFMARVPGAAPRSQEPTRRAPPRAPAREDAIEEGPRPGRAERRVSPARRDDRDDDEPRPRRRRDDYDEEDDYDDRPRSRRRRDEEEDDDDYPRSRRRRYEDEEDDYEDEDYRRPANERQAWRGVRTGLNLVVYAGWTFLGTVAVGVLGFGLLLLLGVSLFSAAVSSGNAGTAAQGAVATAGGLLLLIIVLGLLSLAEVILRLVGYGLCMKAPPSRRDSLRPLAISAFSCAAGAVALRIVSAGVGWSAAPVGFGGSPAFALMAGSNWLSWVGSVAGLVGFFLFLFLLRGIALRFRDSGLARTVVTLIITVGVYIGVWVLIVPIVLCVGGLATFSAASSAKSATGAGTTLGAGLILMLIFVALVGLAGLGIFTWYILVTQRVKNLVDRNLRKMVA